MLSDELQLVNNAVIKRTAIDSGNVFPSNPADLKVFEIKNGVGFADGVYIYSEALTDWILNENTNSDIYDIGLTIFDRPKASDIVCKHIAARTFSIKANFQNSIAKATIAATGATVFVIHKVVGAVATQVGTLTFAAGSTDGVFASIGGAAIVMGRGHILRMTSPEIRDATLASIDLVISGELFVVR